MAFKMKGPWLKSALKDKDPHTGKNPTHGEHRMESLPAKEVVTSERHASKVKGYAEKFMQGVKGGFVNMEMLNNPALWTTGGKLIRGVDPNIDQYLEPGKTFAK